jgi:glycosyltransferase involved in cell wall biosynthesis
MKIVRIIARLNVGGPARHVVWLSAGMKQNGYDTLLVSGVVPPGEEDMAYVARGANVSPFIVREMSREISARDVLTTWKLFRLLVREKPAVVHTHTAKAGTVGRVAGLMYRWLTPATLIGKPRHCYFVHTYHGHVFHSYYGPAKTLLFLTVERMLARLVTDRIVVISEQQRLEINQHFRVGRPEQFAVVPLGIDLTIYEDWPNRREEFRRQLDAAEDEILVGIVGRLTEIKNHRLFLEAAALFKKHCEKRVRFLIVGDGHLRQKLEDEVDILGLQNDVCFLGSRQDPENFYPGIDVLALTSLNEGTPLSLIEAMANARAVIATAVGGVVDLLGPKLTPEPGRPFAVHERGISVASGDADGFSQALAYLISNEALRRDLGDRGRAFVVKNYDKERLITDMSALYGQLLKTSVSADAVTGRSLSPSALDRGKG